ncbi:MAG TPA: DUF4124 domain-containing protein [Geobacteraceae bacterium]
MKFLSLLIGIMIMAVAGVAHADTYKWIDSEGGLHFTDNLDKVPAKYRNKVQKMNVTPVIEKTEGASPQQSVSPANRGADSLYGGHDKAWWRSSFRALRDEIKSIQEGLSKKRERFTALHRKYVIFFKPSDRVASNEVNAEIKKDEARIEELQKQLADLDTEASKAGVPAEWRR